jgi:hypothetical protein
MDPTNPYASEGRVWWSLSGAAWLGLRRRATEEEFAGRMVLARDEDRGK